MGKGRELKVLPSVAETDQGECRKFDEMEAEEKIRAGDILGQRLERCLSGYYSVHPEEWAQFAKAARQAGAGC